MLDEALGYAREGWHLFPLVGKRPATAHGFKDATTDVATIVAQFAGTSYNLGVATGASGLVVVDLDSEEAVEWWLRQDPTPTRVATTGRGQHWYYRGVGRSTVGVLAPQVDTRGEGGYVVAPPSVHPTTGGRYEWADEGPVAPLPRWVHDALKPRRKRGYALDPRVHPDAHVALEIARLRMAPTGQRNNALNASAWVLRGLEWQDRTAQALVAEGTRLGLEWGETVATVASGMGVPVGTVLDWCAADVEETK